MWILLESSWKKVYLCSRESTGIPIYPSKIQSYEKKNNRRTAEVETILKEFGRKEYENVTNINSCPPIPT